MAKLHRRVHGLPHPGLIAVLGALLLASPALAQPSAPARQAAGDEVLGRSRDELDGLLARLHQGAPAARHAAAVELIDSIELEDLPAVRERLLAPLPGEVDAVRIALVRQIRAATGGREDAPYDLLDVLLAAPRGAGGLDVLAERVALARGTARLRSAEAGRVLVALAAAHSGLLRLEVGRLVRAQLRDYVLPALIELRSPSELMRVFIRTLRESLRRVTPGQSVQLHDNALLAEVLRAYGSIRQPDAMKVVVSFVNSERAQVREAARWSVAQYGREAIVALREAYEMYEGHAPNAQWGWERTARELYTANDRHRDAEVTQALDAGLAAGRAGRADEMLERFRHVLARHPLFERRREMVAPLADQARALEGRDASRAEALYRQALWIDPEGPRAGAIRGALLFLQAERALARGVADPELYRASLQADPGNTRARAQLGLVEQSEVLRARRWRRMLGALGLLVLAAAVLWAVTRPGFSRSTA